MTTQTRQSPLTAADYMRLAAHFKTQNPAAYEAVTGRPVWADQVGPEHRAAEAAWLRYVKANVVPAEVTR